MIFLAWFHWSLTKMFQINQKFSCCFFLWVYQKFVPPGCDDWTVLSSCSSPLTASETFTLLELHDLHVKLSWVDPHIWPQGLKRLNNPAAGLLKWRCLDGISCCFCLVEAQWYGYSHCAFVSAQIRLQENKPVELWTSRSSVFEQVYIQLQFQAKQLPVTESMRVLKVRV